MVQLRPLGRFSACDRVRKRSEFRRIQETGRRVVSPGFVFLLQRSRTGSGPRLGITASRRVGNAVQRNRAKRLVREAFRATRLLWPSEAAIVVVVRQAVGRQELSDVVAEWRAAEARIARSWAQLVSEANVPREPTDPCEPRNRASGQTPKQQLAEDGRGTG